MSDDQSKAETEVAILAQARADFKLCDSGEKQPRDEYARCMRFVALDQYPEQGMASKNDRAGAGLPSLVIDQCNPACNQIINDWIRNRMGIQIGPSDTVASEKTAKIFTGYVKNLEYLTHARQHYDIAFRNLVRGGRGYIGLLTRRKPKTFSHELIVRGFPDSQAVYLDPFAQELDGSDNNVSFVRQLIAQDQFKSENPGAQQTDFADWGSDYGDWVKDNGIVVAEYWKAKMIPRKLQKLTHAIRIQRGIRFTETDTVYDNEYKALPDGVTVAPDPSDGGRPMEEDEPERKIIFRKITGREILQETEWPDSIIPIFRMVAKEIIVDGERRIFSAISGGLDAQCSGNYAESGIAAELGSEVHVPWVGALGQFRSQRQSWQDSNIKRFAFLEYDPVIVGEKLAPPPQRQSHEPAIQAFAIAADRAWNNFRTSTGINKSSLGIEDGRAISGVAKKTLIQEGDNNTFDFPDAGANALQLLGDAIVRIAPRIIPEAELLQILNDEDDQESVLVNAPMGHPKMPKDQKDEHWLDEGEYKVRVKAAPSAQTMREQTEIALQELFAELPDPQKVMIAAPLVREMSFNGKDKIADRLELPEYKKPVDGALNIPPEAQAVIDQGKQMIEAANQHIALLEKERDEKTAELQNKLDVTALKGQIDVSIARIAEEAKTGRTMFEAEIQSVQHTLDMITEHLKIGAGAASQESAQAHAADLQAGAQEHATQLQESAQAAEPAGGQE